jgi:hypothetical protein
LLNAKNLAQDDSDEAVTDYAGYAPNAEEEDDGDVAIPGLLSVTEGLNEELDDATTTESATLLDAVVGSTSMRDDAHINYACINCSASADAGTAGSDDFVCQCGGSF